MSRLYFGDNLDVMRERISDASVDLIYLDPPFNSNVNYNVLFDEIGAGQSEAQAEAFQDTWSWGEASAAAFDDVIRNGGDAALLLDAFRRWMGDTGLMAYLAMMAVRIGEFQRILRPTGSIYLHCDPTASHYIKLILDATFGNHKFRNEIVWLRSKNPKGSQHAMKKYGPATDSLLFYGDMDQSPIYLDNIRIKLTDVELAAKYPMADEFGPFADGPILRGKRMGPRENLTYEYKGFKPGPAGWRMERSQLEELDRRGNLAWTRTGGPRRKLRPSDDKGDPIGSFWGDIPPLNSQAKERLGYPTQKPVALLERIIRASSREGQTIFDPFCGCGTTVEAAERLDRQWLGIDVSHYAVTLIETRLRERHPSAKYDVYGRPTTYAGAVDLARRDKYQFQWWAAWLLGTQTYEGKKGKDRGIDGNIYFPNGPYGLGRIIVSVKGGSNISPSMVSELAGVVQRENAEMGVLITLVEPTKAMEVNAAGSGFVAKSAHGRLPRVQIVTVADLLAGRLPRLPPLPIPKRAVTPSRRKQSPDQLEMLLPFAGQGMMTPEGAAVDPRFMQIA